MFAHFPEASNNMLENASHLAAECRKIGVQVIHAPISFAPDGSNNPNKYLPKR